MTTSILVFLVFFSPSFAMSFDFRSWPNHFWRRASRNVPSQGFYNPANNGGSFLTRIPVTFPMGQGEPLNAIISGASDEEVLVDAELNGGLRNYFLSFGFSGECLGQHSGSNQAVDLGDGHGYLNETAVIRWNYGDPQLGSCKETIQGGNHFRYWVQNGPNANSGAIFMAASCEKPIAEQHDIVADGYNLGRDYVVGNITGSTIPTSNLTNGMTFSGSTASQGYTYETEIKYLAGLLANTSIGINHNETVGVDGRNPVDGLVALLTVKIKARPPSSNSATLYSAPSRLWTSSAAFCILVALVLHVS